MGWQQHWPAVEDRPPSMQELQVEIEAITDKAFGPPSDPAGFLRYCWRRYGTGRTEADIPHWPHESSSRRLAANPTNDVAQDLRAVGLDELPVPGRAFNCAAREFFRLRFLRKTATAAVRNTFRDLDWTLAEICRQTVVEAKKFEEAFKALG